MSPSVYSMRSPYWKSAWSSPPSPRGNTLDTTPIPPMGVKLDWPFNSFKKCENFTLKWWVIINRLLVIWSYVNSLHFGYSDGSVHLINRWCYKQVLVFPQVCAHWRWVPLEVNERSHPGNTDGHQRLIQPDDWHGLGQWDPGERTTPPWCTLWVLN